MAYKKAIKKVGRAIYRKLGYKNPMKKGKLSSSRVVKQIPKMMKDLSVLKHMVNSEKHRLDTKVDGLGIAQLNNNISGHYIVDVTPAPSQGDGYNNRQGASIKVSAQHFDFFFQKQSSNVGPINVVIELYQVIGEPFSDVNSGVISKIFDRNLWVDNFNVFDNSSNRNVDHFKTFRCLRRQRLHLKGADYATQAVTIQRQIQMGIKYPSHHVKFNKNSNTLTSGQIILIIRADTGNYGNATSTADNCANTAAFTGLALSWARTDYYYDN